jgi:tetratricopeptide (TPR) repeat protein
MAFEGKGMVYLAQGDFENAIINLEKYQKMIGHPLKGLSALGHAYAAAGYTDKAMDCLEKLKQRQREEPHVILHMDFVFLYCGFKEFDKAFEYLDKTYEQRVGIACHGMIFCVRFPLLKDLKSDPRFSQMLMKMGLQEIRN